METKGPRIVEIDVAELIVRMFERGGADPRPPGKTARQLVEQMDDTTRDSMSAMAEAAIEYVVECCNKVAPKSFQRIWRPPGGGAMQ